MTDSSAPVLLKKTPSLSGIPNLLPASKSISNRALIMDALSGKKSKLENLSDANDTQLMIKLLNSHESNIDVEDAGTTMRFLTAFFAVTNQHKTITGTERMKERPIGILVDALRKIGADISYLNKEGYPPLSINGFRDQQTPTLSIRGDVSSQFISALIMIAPVLPEGLTLNLEGKVGSRPYIEMTLTMMRAFGIESSFDKHTIQIEPQEYKPTDFTIESDWSAASYWFSFVALADKARIELPRISLNSMQGDRAVVDIMKQLGVTATVNTDLLLLEKSTPAKSIEWDFTHCPDLAQTIAVVCAAKGIPGEFTGLESLRIKETDRIVALQNELRKIGADLKEANNKWHLVPATALPTSCSIETYKDHRMAMAFAPLCTRMDVEIKDSMVVRKSYPNFWKDLQNVGLPVA